MASSTFWICALIFAGCAAVIDACSTTGLLFTVSVKPVGSTVVFDSVTLTCVYDTTEDTVPKEVKYEWHRVDGQLPKEAKGKFQEKLTIPNIVPTDEGLYYCKAEQFGHCAISNRVNVEVDDQLAISAMANDSLVRKGRTVQFNATVGGVGKLTYQWWKRGVDILPGKVLGQNTTVLIIPNMEESDEGQYYCNVTNEWGRSVQSSNVTLRFYGPPIITTHPSSQLITGNMSITLNCEGTGRGTIMYQWETSNINGGQWMKISTGNVNTKTLVVKDLDRSELYRCVVSNDVGGTESKIATIIFLKIIAHPQNKILEVNSTINFTCKSSTSSNVTFSWTHNGTSISGSSTTGDTSILTITSVKNSDAGSYMCTVSSGSLSVTSNTATLSFIGPPTINNHPVDTNVAIGLSTTLTCRASGLGTQVYSWETLSGSSWTTVSNNNTSYTTDTTLAIGQYMYRCRVSNEAGSVMSNNAIVNVYGPPTITTHPTSQIINISVSVTLDCEATGRGSIMYQWETSNINAGQWMNISIGKTLVVGSLEQSQQYRCVVSNEAGTNRSDIATVTVLRITTQPLNLTNILALEDVILNCSASIDDVEFSWHRVGDHLSPRSTIDSSGTLTIPRSTPLDEGMYYCIASKDGITVQSDIASVTIDDLLSITVMPDGEVLLNEGQTARFNATASDLSETDRFMYQWKKRGNGNLPDKVLGVNKAVLVIPDLSVSDEEHYYCTVTNEWGNSVRSDDISLYIEEIKLPPPGEFRISEINIYSLVLTWTIPMNSHGKIEHYTVHYYSMNEPKRTINITDFNGMYTLDNLNPYTVYTVYVTAVRLIGDSSTLLEGTPTETITERTLAGKPVINEANLNLVVNTINEKNQREDIPSPTAYLPNVGTDNGPFSHLYLVVIKSDYLINSTKRTVNSVEDITTQDLIEKSMEQEDDPNFYIAAVINANQYKDNNVYRMGYLLGVEDDTSDTDGNRFNNRQLKLENELLYFSRVFSVNSTRENEISATTDPERIELVQEPITSQESNELSIELWMIIVPAVLVFVIIVILLCIIILICYKKRHSKSSSQLEISNVASITPPSVYSTPSSNGKSLKEEALEINEKAIFADQTDQPAFQNTAYLESTVVKTSVDQPTTLVVGLPDDYKARVTWKKDGEPINHPVLTDGSMYIPNTHLTDKGEYTVVINNKDGAVSENLQLTVADPKLPPERSGRKPIKIEDFTEHVASLKEENEAKMLEEFESLVINVTFTQHAARLLCNKSKNRYKNIAPYDHARVVLNQQDLVTGSDYINASHVDGYEEARAYIAAQGPMVNTVNDFWRMIWEQNVSTIVMLTKMIEDNKVKCHRYWPISGADVYGNIKVTLHKEEQLTNYSLRQFIIEQTTSAKNHVRVINQLHFTAWPDHGVPKYATALLEFQKKVDKQHKHKTNKPMLVHCSAGVGRSGTFIAIDTEIQRMKSTAAIDVYDCVRRMRFWRNYMVQTIPQYSFIHLALLEQVTYGVTTISAPIDNVEETINELSIVSPRTYRTGFQQQFETLERDSNKEQDFEYMEAMSLKNHAKNRNQKPLPPDASRVILQQLDGDSDYVNFCYIDGYDQGKAFLTGPGPMKSTASDFWTMIWEKKSYVIVMIGHLTEDNEEVCHKYWPNKKQKCKYGKFLIETTAEETWGQDIVKRTIKLTNTEKKDHRTVTQLHYVEWSQQLCPSTSSPILNLIDVLESIQRKTNNGPITIHCSDGVGRSGTFCALMISMNQFKAEQKVDIFQIIRSMRSQRPGLVGNAGQYKFIHKGLLTMLKQYSPYYNYNDGTSV